MVDRLLLWHNGRGSNHRAVPIGGLPWIGLEQLGVEFAVEYPPLYTPRPIPRVERSTGNRSALNSDWR
jgi:hypothetical protein